MKKIIFNNLGYKITSLALSVIAWFSLSMITNPTTSRVIRDVPVTYNNKSELSSANLIIVSDKQTDGPALTVDVRVQGSRNAVTELIFSDIRATIDLSECSARGDYSLKIKTEFRTNYNADLQFISVEPDSAFIVIDDIESKTLPINIIEMGSLTESYQIAERVLTPTTVTIRGPKAEIESIESAVARINVHGSKDDIKEKLNIELINAGGAQNDNHLIELSSDTVDIYFSVLRRKRVPIVVELTQAEFVERVVYSDEDGTIDVYEGEILNSTSLPTTRTWMYEAVIIGNKDVYVIGPQQLIDSITEIKTRPINPSVYDNGSVDNFYLDIPENVQTEHNIERVTVQFKKTVISEE